MAFPWPGKKDLPPGAKPEFPAALEAELPESIATKGDNPLKSVAREASPREANGLCDPLPALTQRLEELARITAEAKEQVNSYLMHRESMAGDDEAIESLSRKVEALAEKLAQGGGPGLEQKLDALYGKIDQLASASPRGGEANGAGASEAAIKVATGPAVEKIDALKDAIVAAITKLRDTQTEQHNAQSTSIRQLSELVPQYFNALPQYFTAVQQQVVAAQQHADAGLRTIIDILRPPQAETTEEASVGGDWQEALLGGELAHNPALNADKNRLLGGVLRGDPAACGLVGSLLQFRAAAVDKMPPLLKDIGEAFYRWQPKTSSRPGELEKALVQWLVRTCEQAGMANTIELVGPGERFDSLRHNAPRPGVEIAQVLGWIVLRDNGKVYTKASVAVK